MQGGKKMILISGLLLTIIFVVLCIYWKKFRYISLYLYNLVTFGIIHYLNQTILIEWFGCGCVPSIQTNRLGIPFNTNQVIALYYSIVLIVILILSRKFSKDLQYKHLYIATVMLLNILLSYCFMTVMRWL